jgi:hypothetical protein
MIDEKLPAFEDTQELPSFDQTEALPAFEDTQELSQQEPSSEQLKLKTTAATAAIGTEALRKGISGATEYGLEKVGKLTPQEMKLISESPEEYKKARSFSDLLEQFQELGQQTREAGFEARRRGVESLEPLASVRGSDIIPELGNISKAPTMKLSEGELPKIKSVKSKSASELETLLNQKKSLESKISNIQEAGIESIERNKELSNLTEQLNKIDSKITENIPSTFRSSIEQIPPTIEDFEKITNIPKELLQARPELANKKIQKEFGDILKKEIDFLKTGEISPKELANLVRQAQERASYNSAPSEVDKFKQEVARNYSEYLKNLEGAEGYKIGQELSKKAMELEKGFKEFGLGLDSEGNIKITNPKKIENLYKTGNQKEINRLNKYINQAQQLQIDLNVPVKSDIIPTSMDRFQTEFPMASIKKTVEEAKDLPIVTTAKRGIGAAAGGAIGGVPGAIAGYTGAGLLPTGTKLQELASLIKGSQAFKTAAKASKLLGPAAGLLAAGSAYSGAEEVGLEGIEKLGVTAGEVINPIPLTDVTGAYVAGKKGLEEGIIPAVKAAGEAYIKPAKEIIEKPTSIDFNSEALRKMERGEGIPKGMAYKPFSSTKQEDISKLSENLSMSNDKAAQEYARVLNQISGSSEQQKQAVLYSLNQQPAFRELVRKIKGQ